MRIVFQGNDKEMMKKVRDKISLRISHDDDEDTKALVSSNPPFLPGKIPQTPNHFSSTSLVCYRMLMWVDRLVFVLQCFTKLAVSPPSTSEGGLLPYSICRFHSASVFSKTSPYLRSDTDSRPKISNELVKSDI